MYLFCPVLEYPVAISAKLRRRARIVQDAHTRAVELLCFASYLRDYQLPSLVLTVLLLRSLLTFRLDSCRSLIINQVGNAILSVSEEVSRLATRMVQR